MTRVDNCSKYVPLWHRNPCSFSFTPKFVAVAFLWAEPIFISKEYDTEIETQEYELYCHYSPRYDATWQASSCKPYKNRKITAHRQQTCTNETIRVCYITGEKRGFIFTARIAYKCWMCFSVNHLATIMHGPQLVYSRLTGTFTLNKTT